MPREGPPPWRPPRRRSLPAPPGAARRTPCGPGTPAPPLSPPTAAFPVSAVWPAPNRGRSWRRSRKRRDRRRRPRAGATAPRCPAWRRGRRRTPARCGPGAARRSGRRPRPRARPGRGRRMHSARWAIFCSRARVAATDREVWTISANSISPLKIRIGRHREKWREPLAGFRDESRYGYSGRDAFRTLFRHGKKWTRSACAAPDARQADAPAAVGFARAPASRRPGRGLQGVLRPLLRRAGLPAVRAALGGRRRPGRRRGNH